MLDAPRWPASADHRWPEADRLDELSGGAGDVARQAVRARERARSALEELVSCRPGGEQWAQARMADRDAVVASKRGVPKDLKVQALLEGDVRRWAVASAYVTSLTGVLDELRGRLATDANVARCDKQAERVKQAMGREATTVYTASRSSERGAAWSAVEEFRRLASDLAWWQGLKRWLVGSDTSFAPASRPAVPRGTFDLFTDGLEELEGVPDEERRVQRDVRAQMRANIDAALTGQDLPHPELYERQRDQLAALPNRGLKKIGAVS